MEKVLKKPDKLCIDCEYQTSDGWISWCTHRAEEIIDYSPVNGQPYTRGEHACDFYRGEKYRDQLSGCGPEAKYWTPKLPKWPGLWKRLFG